MRTVEYDTYQTPRHSQAIFGFQTWIKKPDVEATPSHVRDLPLVLSSQASYVIVSGFRAALDLHTCIPFEGFFFDFVSVVSVAKKSE